MDMFASPSTRDGGRDASLPAVLAALAPYGDRPLAITYDGRTVGAGYHVTEVKAGRFATLDCGGSPDEWTETILQVEDLEGGPEARWMPAAKFRAILGKVEGNVALDPGARLTIEIGRPGEAMRVHDVEAVRIEQDRAVLALGPRAAVCKPRHRAAAASRCCG
jgi:hypothetical protein